MTADEDFELVRRCLNGNLEQFQALVNKYQERIFLLVYGVVLDRELARDLTQDTFIKAYQALGSFRGKSSFYTWLHKIGFNLALDSKRVKLRRPIQVELDDSRESIAIDCRKGSLQPDKEVLREELNAVIRQGLKKLTRSQRTAVLLREWEGYSYREIADLMKCSLGTVMSRLYYGREKLKEYLKPYLRAEL